MADATETVLARIEITLEYIQEKLDAHIEDAKVDEARLTALERLASRVKGAIIATTGIGSAVSAWLFGGNLK